MTVTVGFLTGGEWKVCFGNSLIDLLFYDAAHTGQVVTGEFPKMGLPGGANSVVTRRNKLAKHLVDHPSTEWLFMVDDDMGFAPDTVDRLVEAADPVHRPIVGGLAFAMKSDGVGPFFARRYRCTPTVYRWVETDTDIGFAPWFDYPRDQLVEVDSTGAAVVLIHRTVFEKIQAEYGDRWFDPLRIPHAGTEVEFGEDMAFCLRAKACGFPVHVHTGVKTTHDKGGVFFDEETYDLQQAFKRAAA